jgi:hypothetical protein
MVDVLKETIEEEIIKKVAKLCRHTFEMRFQVNLNIENKDAILFDFRSWTAESF